MTFNEILLRERKRMELSQEALAGRINVSRQAVSKWETGEAMPDLPKLMALADALDISLDVLCGRETVQTAPASTEPTSPKSPSKKRGLHILLACTTAVLLLCVGMLVFFLSAPSSPSPVGIAADFTVAGLNFYGDSTTQVRYQFTPSISAEGVSYQIIFVTPRGKTFPIDAPCVSGVCAGEAMLDKAYSGYSVSVSVTDGRVTRSIPVAHNLTFSQGEASWTPTT